MPITYTVGTENTTMNKDPTFIKFIFSWGLFKDIKIFT